MSETPTPVIEAAAAPPRVRPSVYPSPFVERMEGRLKRPIGDLFGLKSFGVNFTELQPGAMSALMHRHARQDEFVYVVQGEVWLATEAGEWRMTAGMCAGFPAGGAAHHLINRSAETAAFIEVGDRGPGDSAEYPMDDLVAVGREGGGWTFTHKDGRPY
jgi:uncharacterized cupin superfamily protein